MKVSMKNVSGMIFKHAGYDQLTDQSLDLRSHRTILFHTSIMSCPT